MSDPTKDASVRLPTAREVYDAIMGGIEPELVTDQLPLLDAKYANETPVEKTVRMERYGRAFVAYEIAYEAYEQSIRRSADACRKSTRSSQESDDALQADSLLA